MRRRLLSAISFLLCSIGAVSASAETYIVPLWAHGLRGIGGYWYTQLTVVNPNPYPVSIRIPRVFPFGRECLTCSEPPREVTIAAGASYGPLAPPVLDEPLAAAFEVQSSGPIAIHAVAYGPGRPEIRQRMDIAHRWLPPGSHVINTVERPERVWRMNVFVTNPSSEPLEVTAWLITADKVRITVPAKATGALTLPRCACGVTTEYPPSHLTVHVEANGEFLASVSTVDDSWAMFSVADEARQ